MWSEQALRLQKNVIPAGETLLNFGLTKKTYESAWGAELVIRKTYFRLREMALCIEKN